MQKTRIKMRLNLFITCENNWQKIWMNQNDRAEFEPKTMQLAEKRRSKLVGK